MTGYHTPSRHLSFDEVRGFIKELKDEGADIPNVDVLEQFDFRDIGMFYMICGLWKDLQSKHSVEEAFDMVQVKYGRKRVHWNETSSFDEFVKLAKHVMSSEKKDGGARDCSFGSNSIRILKRFGQKGYVIKATIFDVPMTPAYFDEYPDQIQINRYFYDLNEFARGHQAAVEIHSS